MHRAALLPVPRLLPALCALLIGCAMPGHPREPPDVGREQRHPLRDVVPQGLRTEVAARRAGSVVLVTIDGARWQEIFGGVDAALARRHGLSAHEVVPADVLLPNLHRRVAARGVAIGAPGHGLIRASGPRHVSLPGYLELLSGSALGCTDNDCAPTKRTTILDEVRALPGVQPVDVAAIGSWEVLERAVSCDPASLTVSTGRSVGVSRERVRAGEGMAALLDVAAGSSPWPGHGDYRADRFTGPIALGYLRARRPRFLFVGLGDTDEHAHRDDYRSYLHALRAADDFVGELLDVVTDDTVVLVTADHGRASDFSSHGRDAASSRVFLLATGGGLPVRGAVDTSDDLRLGDVATTLRALFGLPTLADRAPIDALLPANFDGGRLGTPDPPGREPLVSRRAEGTISRSTR